MLSRHKSLVAAIVAAAALAGVIIALVVGNEPESALPPDLPGATREELEFLPPRFPSALVRDASDAAITGRGDELSIRLTLSRAGDPTDTMLFYAERLRDAGWQVPPSGNSSRASFRGFGWKGDVRSERDGSRSETVIVLEGKQDQ